MSYKFSCQVNLVTKLRILSISRHYGRTTVTLTFNAKVTGYLESTKVQNSSLTK